jgi:hypothetical protein
MEEKLAVSKTIQVCLEAKAEGVGLDFGIFKSVRKKGSEGDLQ